MTKRCCATTCYNSQAVSSGDTVTYFCLPKGELAQEWAARAGREDLLNRSYKTLGKYFLCSDHFTDDCFYDTNRTLLKRREGVVPTIFKNNLEKFVPPSLKVNTTTVIKSESRKRHRSDSHDERLEVKAKQWCLGNFKGQDDTLNSHDEWTEEFLSPCDLDNFIEVDQTQTDNQIVDNLGELCRLCALPFPNDIAVPIFDVPESVVAKTIEQLLPNQIKRDDGKPQAVCLSCWDKAQTCLSTLQMFTSAQNRFDNS